MLYWFSYKIHFRYQTKLSLISRDHSFIPSPNTWLTTAPCQNIVLCTFKLAHLIRFPVRGRTLLYWIHEEMEACTIMERKEVQRWDSHPAPPNYKFIVPSTTPQLPWVQSADLLLGQLLHFGHFTWSKLLLLLLLLLLSLLLFCWNLW